MKRAFEQEKSPTSPSLLKRRPSSLFSFFTATDDEDNQSTGVSSNREGNFSLKLVETQSAPTVSTAEASLGDHELLCLEDDEPPCYTSKSNLNACPDAAGFLPSAVEILAASAYKEERLDLRTGIVHEASSGHFDRSKRLHKERPARVLAIIEALENDKQNLLDRCHSMGSFSEPEAEDFLQDEHYLRVHLPGYMQRLNKFGSCNCAQLDREAAQYKSIFLTEESTKEAKRAASSLCTLVSKVVAGELDNGFAVIRPPGHHAEAGMAGGYCLINNVAVAAAYARARLGVSKVLIVDWDIHHGNGTQSIFLNDPDVLYFSVHRWDGGNFYPFLSHGGPTTVGVGPGQGFNVNVGWNRKNMGDEEYFAVWEHLLMPMAREFQPELVLVSSGFDGAAGDMGDCDISPECFHLLTGALMSLAQGRVICALEGGYVRSVLQACVKAVVQALLDPRSPDNYTACEQQAMEERQGRDILDEIDASAAKSIRATILAHAPYWNSLAVLEE